MEDEDGLDAHLNEVLVGGVEQRDIVIFEYDPRWVECFETERARILDVLDPAEVVGLDHVGSTSVPGLAAKPIIDMQLAVVHPTDESTYVPALVRLGYEIRVREPDHRMLRTAARDVHLHIWAEQAQIDRHLLFRDWLRHSTADRDAYAELKRDLASQDWRDMNHYAAAKGPLIEQITERALEWNAAGRPT